MADCLLDLEGYGECGHQLLISDAHALLQLSAPNLISGASAQGFNNLGHIPEILQQDITNFLHTFNGYMPKASDVLSTAVTVGTGLLWLIIYFHFLYRSDREALTEEGDGSVNIVHASVPSEKASDVIGPTDAASEVAEANVAPDYIIVFRHPSLPAQSADDTMFAASLERLQVCPASADHGTDEDFSKALEGQERCSLGDAQTALLQTLCDRLPYWGFDVSTFASVDCDEVHLCIRLKKLAAIEHYLMKYDQYLRIRPEIVEKLGISHPRDDPTSHPPAIRYDPQLLERLHSSGIIAERSLSLLHDGVVPCNTDSIRIIYRRLSEYVNLPAAAAAHIIEDLYPSHAPEVLEKVRHVCASRRGPFGLALRQPLLLLESYFGSRLAFSLAWNVTYCRALLALIPIALLCEVWGVADFNTGNPVCLLGFPLLLMAWARMAFNMWEREQAFFKVLWDRGHEEHIARPEFRGQLQPSYLDANVKELTASPLTSRFWELFSVAVTVIYCAVSTFCLWAWKRSYQDGMDNIGSMGLSILIVAFSYCYRWLAGRLVDWENHKWALDYYNSLVWKLFTVEAFLRYFVFAHGLLCLDRELKQNLIVTIVSISCCDMLGACSEMVQVKCALWYEAWKLRGLEWASVRRPLVEEQAKYSPHRVQQQVEVIVGLALSLGHVVLFGGLAPVAAALAFAMFFVRWRASAHLLLYWSQRPFPRTGTGLSSLLRAFNILLQAGAFTTAFLVAVYSAGMGSAPSFVKLSGVLFVVALVHTMWILVDLILPPDDGAAKMLKRKQRYVMNKTLMCGTSKLPSPDRRVQEQCEPTASHHLTDSYRLSSCCASWNSKKLDEQF